jgi:hypothetical protein
LTHFKLYILTHFKPYNLLVLFITKQLKYQINASLTLLILTITYILDPLNEPMPFKLGEDFHESGSIVIVPKLEGAHKIIGLIEGRDFEAQIFVLNEPAHENLFEMNSYSETENLIERPFIITLKEPNLEVDVTGTYLY